MSVRSPSRAPSGHISRLPYLPGLDGMRAIAVVAVMIYHANSSWLQGGFLGVEVFFVISGYLITLLLIAEHERDERIDLKSFWVRRFRRLLPGLYLMLALLMVYLALFNRSAQGRNRGDIVAGVTYVSNWYQIWVGAGYTAAEAFAPLRHLWSLAVEEQFYLVWPLVMILILRRGRAHLPRVALWLVGVSVAITVVIAALFVSGDIDSTCTPGSDSPGYWSVAGRCISINDTLYLSTITRAGGLMLGAAFAMLWRPVAIARGPLRDKGRQLDLVALAGVVVLAMMMWRVYLAEPAADILTGSRFDPWLFRGGLFVAGLATVMVIAAVTHAGSLTGRLLGTPVLAWIGTRSYGLYLFHWPIYQIIRGQAGVKMSLGQFLLAMLLTVPITELSYRLVEQPVRKGAIGAWLRREREPLSSLDASRRKQFTVAAIVAGVLVVGSGISVAVAPNQCAGEVECTSEAGREALAQSTTTSAVPTTMPVSPDPTQTTTPGPVDPTQTTVPVPVTTAAPAVPPPPVAIGESVMLGAVKQLQAGGFTVNADESRQGKKAAEVVGLLKAGGQLGPVVVIQSGTNGSVSAETYDQMMQYLPPAEHPTVVFLTVWAERGWIEENNARIAALPSKYPNVKVVDWKQLVVTGQVPGLCNDGIHLCKASAQQTFANAVFEAIGRPDLVKPVG
jgi:peptidoglycan/LPS O-acetylase OafA/YrhL